ncbi:phosphate ABC transporter permease PstA [Candidatus Hepatincola sp. Av]
MIYLQKNTRKKVRKVKEILFQSIGIGALLIAFFMMFVLIFTIFSKGYTAFYQHTFRLNITFKKNIMFDAYNNNDYSNAYTEALVNDSLIHLLRQQGIKDISENEVAMLYSKESLNRISDYIISKQSKVLNTSHNFTMLVSSDADMVLKGYLAEGNLLSANIITSIKLLYNKGIIHKVFNQYFFTHPDSRYPEIAGIAVAFMGSVYTILLTLVFSVVFSIGAAVYLEEFAKQNMLFKIIEVNINNLAAIPSVIFGLLGLIIFEQCLGVPRSSSLLASLVLTLMALPTIIITSRIALATVPNTVKEAAYGVGSSKVQVIWHHVLPIATPGIITGIVLGISRIIGETAPLLMIGMVAFINTIPTSPLDNALVFPVQILLWSDSPELGYIEKASAAIMLLVMFLIVMNGVSIYLRNKFSTKL